MDTRRDRGRHGHRGLTALLIPRPLLRVGFGIESIDASVMFFVRHWGVLIFAIGALLVYSAFHPVTRLAILSAAAGEKFAVGILIFFGPVKPTNVMRMVALADGVFAALYVAYLAGL